MLEQKNSLNNHTIPTGQFENVLSHKNETIKTVAEYFAGIGLVRLGLEKAGWRTIFANDYSIDKYEMYASNFQDADSHYLVQDIFAISSDFIPTTIMATASFPCIDLSVAGNRQGLEGKYSSAFWGFIEILKQQAGNKPKLVLLENVNGWLTSNGGKDFRLTIEALNSLGYACDMFSLDAIRFTPQSRPRIFVVGILTNKPNGDVFKLLRRPESLALKAMKNALEKNFDLKWHTLNIPSPPAKKESGLVDIIEDMSDEDSRWWDEAVVEKHMRMMSPKHNAWVQEHLNTQTYYYRTMYRRVRQGKQRAEIRSDEIAGCLRTARGGSSRQMLVRMGKGNLKMRHLTPREYARLQGVPDDYVIQVNINQSLTGFGDAVCVPVITWIGENILNPLLDELLTEVIVH